MSSVEIDAITPQKCNTLGSTNMTNSPTVTLTETDKELAKRENITEDEARLAKDLHNLALTALDNNVSLMYVIGLLSAKEREMAAAADRALLSQNLAEEAEQYDTLPLEIDDKLREAILSQNNFARVTTTERTEEDY